MSVDTKGLNDRERLTVGELRRLLEGLPYDLEILAAGEPVVAVVQVPGSINFENFPNYTIWPVVNNEVER